MKEGIRKIVKESEEGVEELTPPLLTPHSSTPQLPHSERPELRCGSSFARAADSARGFLELQAEPKRSVKLHDARRRLVRQDDGPGMAREPLGDADLIVPAEAAFRVVRELDVVGRIGVDEVGRPEIDVLEVAAGERPARQTRPE